MSTYIITSCRPDKIQVWVRKATIENYIRESSPDIMMGNMMNGKKKKLNKCLKFYKLHTYTKALNVTE